MHFSLKKMVIAAIAVLMAQFTFSVPATAQDQQAQSADYRINPGDSVEIYVWGEERLQRTVNVLPDGSIAFPLVGQLNVRGLLPSELEQRIRDGLQDQYRGDVPQVTVSVAPSGMQFSIIGRVNSPGSFQPGRYVNALEALSLAGGPNEFADLNNVVIIRKNGTQLQTIRVRMAALFKSGVSERDVANANLIRIESGDTVIVP
ncbi:polysaccharide biosynthesis/export family protein [Qipengyuania atrilutea]|uniref:Polysaccharide biosynthesis/export family protein n=1 Tax=Qipengyuania atrilutea TaxID=2744473 RepID=A0A850H1D0_9SPHN|nr:polysaccharide biosynthesis/export family protein [Actirhodobacter atriluteus]NVD45751.1 polysaccharide biosynthesis/export family protein [Actirhodobacter atriluteus]